MKYPLRHQADSVFAAMCRAKAMGLTALGLTAQGRDEYVAHLAAAETTLRWLEKNESKIRTAIAGKETTQ